MVLNEPADLSLAELARMASAPLRAAGAQRAVAFGSYARGCADAWSDLDLAVVIETELPRRQRGRALDELVDALPVPLDLLVFTPSEFERGMASGMDVFDSILADGKTIFPDCEERHLPRLRGTAARTPRRTACRWLGAANEDLEFARHAFDGDYCAHACFGAHQAAEKALKAVHYAQGARSVLGHSVRNLVETAGARSLEAVLPAARELDLCYLCSRYPHGSAFGTPGDTLSEPQAIRALECAQQIVAAATAVIGQPVRD